MDKQEWELKAHREYVNCLVQSPQGKEDYLKGVQDCYREYFSDLESLQKENGDLQDEINNLEEEIEELKEEIENLKSDY